MKIFMLPDLGEGLHEAEIVSWHVSEGDHIVADQPLVSVETDKAVVEIPSPQSGTIARLLARPGDRIKVGAPLVEFEQDGHADTGAVVGTLAPEPSREVPHLAAAAAVPHIVATPAVRALARERGVDLAELTGTGPGGAITRADVDRVVAAGQTGGERLRGVRRAMAINMARAHVEVVPATLWDEVDIEAWRAPDADVTLRLVQAIAAACAAEPALNVWFDGTTLTRHPVPKIDLGIAVDTPDGLIVPVLRDIAGRDGAALRCDLDALKIAARNRTLSPADLRGPTITLSNFGVLAGRQAALVVVPPQVAIIGAGRISLAAVPGDTAVRFHHVLPLSLTFDHRVVTGGEAARFLQAMIDALSRASPTSEGQHG
jgi:2-oxoisovalerate dehydrogenase E2 component (dihydrolipoyl transacylase)